MKKERPENGKIGNRRVNEKAYKEWTKNSKQKGKGNYGEKEIKWKE